MKRCITSLFFIAKRSESETRDAAGTTTLCRILMRHGLAVTGHNDEGNLYQLMQLKLRIFQIYRKIENTSLLKLSLSR